MIRTLATCFAIATLSGCYVEPTPNSDGSITVENASSYVFTEMRVAAIDSLRWGPNLIGALLYPNEQVTVVVACDSYDVLVVDEHGRECVLTNLDLCSSDAAWTIDNVTLRNCAF